MGCLAISTIHWISIEDAGPSTSSALRPGEEPQRRMGAVCECGDTDGRFAIGSDGLRASPFPRERPSRRRARTLWDLTHSGGILSSAAATGRAGTSTWGRLSLRLTVGARLLSAARASSRSPVRHPSREAAGGMAHLIHSAVLVRRGRYPLGTPRSAHGLAARESEAASQRTKYGPFRSARCGVK